MIPQSVWQPSAKDLRTEFAPVALRARASVTQAAAILTANIFTCPVDFVIELTSILVQGVGGAAQNPTLVRAAIVDELGATIATIASWSPGGAAGSGGAAGRLDGVWSGHVMLMPKEILQVEADFSAGAAANILGCGAHGVQYPRGTWQIG